MPEQPTTTKAEVDAWEMAADAVRRSSVHTFRWKISAVNCMSREMGCETSHRTSFKPVFLLCRTRWQ